MSTEAQEWLVIIPDKPGVVCDAGLKRIENATDLLSQLPRRIAIRPKHSPNFVRLHNEGYVSWAGPVFSEPCIRNKAKEDRPFMGSIMVVNDESPEKIYEKLRTDPFIQEGIWDWEKVEILPFKTATRTP
jgi:uncharacterized protein YciI